MSISQERRLAEREKQEYPPGTRLVLINMTDPYNPVPPGTRGTVRMVDDIGTLHMKFDNGRTLGIVPGEDSFRKLTRDEMLAEFEASKGIDPNMFDKSAVFHCDETLGFPTMFCYNSETRMAWLELDKSLINESEDITMAEDCCMRWGVRPCGSGKECNMLLRSLSEEAYNVASVIDEAEHVAGEILRDKIRAEIERTGAAGDREAMDRVREYVSAFENSAPLTGVGLDHEDRYRLISEHGGYLLAGRDYSGKEVASGYQFVTWQYSYDKTGLTLGHYYPTWAAEFGTNAYERAKEDFAVRSGLVKEDKIFNAEQLDDIYFSVRYFANSDNDLTREHSERLQELLEQIERLWPESAPEPGPQMTM